MYLGISITSPFHVGATFPITPRLASVEFIFVVRAIPMAWARTVISTPGMPGVVLRTARSTTTRLLYETG